VTSRILSFRFRLIDFWEAKVNTITVCHHLGITNITPLLSKNQQLILLLPKIILCINILTEKLYVEIEETEETEEIEETKETFGFPRFRHAAGKVLLQHPPKRI